MPERRRICVVTGTRADYGLLYWLLKELQADQAVELQLVVCAMHLSPEFGCTYRVIEEDGFAIDEKVEMLLSADTPTAIAKSIGLGCIGFAEAFARLRPDILVLLGDRYEMLAAAQAALVTCLPIAHIHGGEATEGLIDEAIRHAITKMAHLHFVAAEPFRHRVIQLGECPDRVFTVGAPGLDNLRHLELQSRTELETELNFALGELTFLVTYHPVTLSSEKPSCAMSRLLSAIDGFSAAQIILTYPNADTFGRKLIEQIAEFAAAQPGRVLATPSLGQRRYLSTMRHASVVIGNSSSALIEAPSLKVPTVNVGSRQAGRLRAASVIDCADSETAIRDAIEQATSVRFRAELEEAVNPYGDGYSAPRISSLLRETPLSGILMKRFYDLRCA